MNAVNNNRPLLHAFIACGNWMEYKNYNSYISLPGICETGYCQIKFTSVDESSQGRCTNCAQPLELNKGSTTPAVDDCVHIGIGIVVLTVGYDNVTVVVNIEANHITGSLSRYTLYLQV